MQQSYTVDEVAQAIGYWRKTEICEPCTIGPKVRVLADVLGVMIWEHAKVVALTALSQPQKEALLNGLDGFAQTHPSSRA